MNISIPLLGGERNCAPSLDDQSRCPEIAKASQDYRDAKTPVERHRALRESAIGKSCYAQGYRLGYARAKSEA
jgi:hypothetical protein